MWVLSSRKSFHVGRCKYVGGALRGRRVNQDGRFSKTGIFAQSSVNECA